MAELRERLRLALADRYRLERELGRGGMATVFLAHDLRHDRPVALKVLHPELAATLGPERFQREIKLAARLQHPNILTVHDSGEADGQLWFTMPFVEGESLRERLRRERQLSVNDALRIATDAARALDYAHQHGVIHRDIKPENLLLTKDGSTLVADFGIARALGGDTEQLTETGLAVGTPAYMSPEQACGERELDDRTDLYSLGCVLYEMLAGEPPYTGATAQAIIAKRLSEPVPRLRTLREVPDEVERAVSKALARAPVDRFRTAAEFVAALGAVSSQRRPPFIRRKSIAALAGIGLLTVLGWWVATRRSGPEAPAAPAEKSIAVLPFVNLSADKENEYFSDGMTEELITALSKLKGLRVAARTSAFAFRGKNESVREIGRQLRVGTVLEGSVRRAGDRLRITAQLINAQDGYHLWSETYDRHVRDVFAVQDELSRAIAEALQVRLTGVRNSPSVSHPKVDLAAYDLYLKGRHAWHRRTADGLAQARQFFEQAIGRDPGFARAYAGLADVYVVLPLWSDLPPSQTYPRARAAALQALALDSTLAEPHAALGDVHALYEWDWPEAERRFQRALVLDPNSANTYHWYGGDYLSAVGRTGEAVEAEQRARELDPLSPTINAAFGMALYRARRYRDALAHLEEVRSLEPDFTLTNAFLGQVHLIEGRYADAIQAMERSIDPAVRHSGDLAFLGYAYARAGKRGDAEKLLRELHEREARGYVSPANLALLLTGLGDTLQAFRWLERAADERDPFLVYHFVSDPLLEGLRKKPRGQALLRRMHLPYFKSPPGQE